MEITVTSSSPSLSLCESLLLKLSQGSLEESPEREGEIIPLKKLEKKLSAKKQPPTVRMPGRYIRGGKAPEVLANRVVTIFRNPRFVNLSLHIHADTHTCTYVESP